MNPWTGWTGFPKPSLPARVKKGCGEPVQPVHEVQVERSTQPRAPEIPAHGGSHAAHEPRRREEQEQASWRSE